MTMKKIGFIGLGIMGKPMAINLLKAGYSLTVYDIVPEKMKEVVPSYRNDVVDLSGQNQISERIYQFFTESIEPETERLLSEDYHFCRTWRQMGGKIYAAPWMNLGHVGSYIFEGQLIAEPSSEPSP